MTADQPRRWYLTLCGLDCYSCPISLSTAVQKRGVG